jgi:branched-chain amino acid transport system permease protein
MKGPAIGRYVPLALSFVAVIALSASGVMNQYVQTVLMFIGINVIFAASLNVVNGYMGEFSCGHAGFMAVGAYVSSVLSAALFAVHPETGAALVPSAFAIPLFPVIVLAGGAAAGIAGLLVAIPSFKTRDDYLAIITLAANFIIVTVINNLEAVGGSRGFMGMKAAVRAMDSVAPLPWMMVWIFVFTVFSVVAIRRLMGSVLGKGISAIRYDEISAEIMSVNTNRMKLIAFMFSSALAGVSGALFAHVLGFINPGSFSIMKSTEGLVMVYLGGMGSLSGSILSAGLFTILLELLRPFQIFKWVLIPLLLILLMQFRPEGILGNRELSDFIPGFRKFFRGGKRHE